MIQNTESNKIITFSMLILDMQNPKNTQMGEMEECTL